MSAFLDIAPTPFIPLQNVSGAAGYLLGAILVIAAVIAAVVLIYRKKKK